MRGIERVKRARSQFIMAGHFFFAALALGLDIFETDAFPTMATDGEKLAVNVAFADSLTDAEMRFVLAHETMHCSKGHHWRRGDRDPEVWNEAGDYEINGELIEMRIGEPPKGVLHDPRFRGMDAESIFAVLWQERQKRGGKPKPQAGQPGGGKPQPGGQPGAPQPQLARPTSGDPGRCGEVIDAADPQDVAKMAEAKAKWESKVFAAAAAERTHKAGTLPAGLARLVEEKRTPPRVSWRDVLRRFVDQSVTKEPQWSRPNRRFVGRGMYLPGMVSDATQHVLIAIDTSGSIDRSMLSAFESEIGELMASGAVDKITVVYCDTQLDGEHEIEAGEEVRFKARGGGGTAFAPVMTWADGKDAACLIYFTDLLCDDFGTEPSMPVLWAKWSSGYPAKPAPFGEIIKIDPHG